MAKGMHIDRGVCMIKAQIPPTLFGAGFLFLIFWGFDMVQPNRASKLK